MQIIHEGGFDDEGNDDDDDCDDDEGNDDDDGGDDDDDAGDDDDDDGDDDDDVLSIHAERAALAPQISTWPHCLANQEGLESPLAMALDGTLIDQTLQPSPKSQVLWVGFQQSSNERFYMVLPH